ncbi:MAG: MFS transporter [Candidatus Lokiarchaeota archaeon]|nr:MFS transporter [Candidatus Lokiarchaeota archaeon]
MEELANNQTFKRYIFLWSAQLFSIMGSAVVNFAITWWITVLTGSATLLSISVFIYVLPMAFLTPVAGVLADRWSRKKLVAIADSLQALTTVWVIILFAFGVADPLAVMLITGLRGICQAFHVPTINAITPTMVPKDKISRMNGFNYLFSSLISIVGPVLGALLYELFQGDISLILWIDIITFIIAFIPLLFTKIPEVERSPIEEKKDSFLFEFKTGIKTIRLIPGLLTLLLLSMLLNFLLMPFNVLLPYYVEVIHDGSAADFAFIMVFFQIGMVLGALLTSVKKEWKRKVFTYFGSLMVICVMLSGYTFAPNGSFLFLAIGNFVVGFLLPIGNTIYMTIIQTTVPNDKMGRVISIDQSISSLIAPFGALISGPLADVIGARIVFFLSSIIGILATSYTWSRLKARKVNYNDKAALIEVAEKINNVNGNYSEN